MLTWGEFALARPDLAEAARWLICQFGVALAFLATVRKDSAPRLHPIAPQFAEAGLFGFIIASPKLNDLFRDGRYAMHSYPGPANEAAFYLSGRVGEVIDPGHLAQLRSAYVAEPERK